MKSPAPIDPRIQEAIRLQQTGKLKEASEKMRGLLNIFPKNTILLTYLGSLALQQGNSGEGIRLLRKSLSTQPDQPMAMMNLAMAWTSLGKYPEALGLFDRLITLGVDSPEARFHRGWALQALQRPAEALVDYDRAIELQPAFPGAHLNRGLLLERSGRVTEALVSYESALALQPNLPEAHFNKGNVLRRLQKNEEAVATFNQAIALRPEYVEALNNRGSALLDLGRTQEALDDFERTLTLQPTSALAHNNRGNALRWLGRILEALAAYDQAIRLREDFAEAFSNRGTVLQELHRFEEAFASYDRGLELDPANPEAKWNKAFLKLLTGDFLEGWKLYDLRKKERSYNQPCWSGKEPLGDRTLFVYAEHGYGDILQYCRYLPKLEAMGARVLFEAPRALLFLLETLPGKITFIEKGNPIPSFDFYCPMMSLPGAFQTTLESIPMDIPYLRADAGRIADWESKLGAKSKPRVGLAWSGRAQYSNDRNRSMDLSSLGPLLELPMEFHSLQKEYRGQDRALMEKWRIRDHHHDLDDFFVSAALVMKMDLVLSVDTSVAHLAGALGKKVWILLPHLPDYRWLLKRSDSPWYPTATLLRQPAFGDWESPVLEAAQRMKSSFGPV